MHLLLTGEMKQYGAEYSNHCKVLFQEKIVCSIYIGNPYKNNFTSSWQRSINLSECVYRSDLPLF